MSQTPTRIHFREYTQHVPPNIPVAVQRTTSRFAVLRGATIAQTPQWEELRQAAHDVRLRGIERLDELIAQVERVVQAQGGRFHYARTAQDARRIVCEIARQHNVKTVVKSKSMATEEIALNHALEQNGVRTVETDLGEYIIQLAGMGPSHIIAPAIHLTKEGIAELFTQKLGVPYNPNPRVLCDLAREKLRQEFLRAEMGVSGANFVIAETGTVVLLTNEGNGRMCTTLPPTHVAVAGTDKLVPDWDCLNVLLKVLARSATGQKMSVYTSFVTGARRAEGEDGAREFHLVLLDHCRARIREDAHARETLLCIRCGACLNVCPVYNQVGGYAYGWAYSGPIGAILAPQLLGTRVARELPYASTLCGACADICPVKIPIPNILLHLRHRVAEGDHAERATAPLVARWMARFGALGLRAPALYRAGAAVLRIAQKPFQRGEALPALPPPLSRWTRGRDFPAFAAGFREWAHKRIPDFGSFASLKAGSRILDAESKSDYSAIPDFTHTPKQAHTHSLSPRQPGTRAEEITKLIEEINKVSARAQRLGEQEIGKALNELVEQENIRIAALWTTPNLAPVAMHLRALGVEIVPPGADKYALAQADLGITEADFALPESGTLGLLSSPEKPRAVSLLPRVHLAIVRASALRADLHPVLEEAKQHGYLVFITGPSRTADIELTLTLGVHGPKALYVWVVE